MTKGTHKGCPYEANAINLAADPYGQASDVQHTIAAELRTQGGLVHAGGSHNPSELRAQGSRVHTGARELIG